LGPCAEVPIFKHPSRETEAGTVHPEALGNYPKKILQGFVATKPNKTGKTNPARRKKIG
jgi:hypothetical protein